VQDISQAAINEKGRKEEISKKVGEEEKKTKIERKKN